MKIVRAKAEDAATLTEIAFSAKRHWRYPERWIAAWHRFQRPMMFPLTPTILEKKSRDIYD